MRASSSPRALPTAVMLAGVLSCASLGVWQLGRDTARNAGRDLALRVAELPAVPSLDGDTTWRRVALPGHFSGAPLLESGVVLGSEPGYEVWAAFDVDGGGRALVDRGWLPAAGIEERLARLPAPTRVEGQVRPLRGDANATPLAMRGTASVWPPGASAAMAANVAAPVGILAPEALGDRPARPLLAVPPRDDTSLHYALQWFAIAAALLAFWVRAGFRSGGTAASSRAP